MIHKKIQSFKASKPPEVPNLVIEFLTEIPKSSNFNDLKDLEKFYKNEGKSIVDALWKSLPGGIIDAILVELLTKKKSLFRVTF